MATLINFHSDVCLWQNDHTDDHTDYLRPGLHSVVILWLSKKYVVAISRLQYIKSLEFVGLFFCILFWSNAYSIFCNIYDHPPPQTCLILEVDKIAPQENDWFHWSVCFFILRLSQMWGFFFTKWKRYCIWTISSRSELPVLAYCSITARCCVNVVTSMHGLPISL